MYKILIVDNDLETAGTIEHFLKREGYRVACAFSVRDALVWLDKNAPDLFVIDVLSPGLDGITLCRKVRSSARTANIPIILTGPNSRQVIPDALEAGGDDFVGKPFALRELAARIRAHLRRVSGTMSDTLPTLRIVPETQAVFVNERPVTLTQVEFELLTYLCRKPNQLHRTQDLLSDVWQYPHGAGDAALVRNHVRNLRRKVEEDPDRPSIIQSRHGRGYAVRASIRFENPFAQST
ncbi:MAG: response regulator transcription factor [Anaerolineae bacterium]|nr:response regulator transcription factor [Anaerolineae bacterium]MBN8618551.1 response regulator transcription factor [Anaerolineae bacterium]